MRFQFIKTQQTVISVVRLASTQPIIHSNTGAKMRDLITRGKNPFTAGCLVLAVLSACGGGASNVNTDGTTIPTISGKVIDGYIRGATVYWDCNNNNQFDNGEISTVTTAGGNYTIADKSSLGCELLATVGVDAIDESRPYTSGQSYTMKAVAGRNDLITPFSTLIAGRVSSTGVTAAKAEADIASLFGINSSLLVDYKANNTGPDAVILSTGAAVIAESLHKNQKNVIFTDGVTKTYDDIKTRFAQTGFLDSVSRGLVPFVDTYRSISDMLSKFVLGNANNRLYRKVNFDDPAANNFLDAMVLEVNNRGAVKYGAVNWGAFSNSELKYYLKETSRINALKSDSAVQAKIQEFQAKRTLLFNAASAQLSKDVDDATGGIWGFFSNDPGATVNYLLEASSIGADMAIDVATLASPIRPKLGRPANLAKSISGLKVKAKGLSYLASTGKCLVAGDDLLDESKDISASLVGYVTSCGALVADVISDTARFAKIRAISDAAKASLDATGGFPDTATTDEKTLTVLKGNMVFLGLVHDIVGIFANDPVTQKILAVLDLEIQVINAYTAGWELEISVSKVRDEKANVAIAKFDNDVALAWRGYYITYLQVIADYHFEIADSTLVKPTIGNMSPLISKNGIATTFTVVGRYLPATDHLDITFNGCANIQFVSQSATQHQFTCTPTVADTLTAVVRTLPGTTPLGSFPVLVSTGPLLCTLPQVESNGACVTPTNVSVDIPATNFINGLNVALSANGYGADTLMNAPPYGAVANAAEWVINAPPGRYELFATYASGLSRPVTISFDGTTVFTNALAAVTGGFFPANRQTLSQGIVHLPTGASIMRVTRGDVFPHIKGFTLVPVSLIEGSFQVNANDPLGTSFAVPNGVTSCTFNATGNWINNGVTSNANGDPTFPPNVTLYLQSAYFFSLIAKSTNGYQLIGASQVISVAAGQTFSFMTNEGVSTSDFYYDNSGSLLVSYTCH